MGRALEEAGHDVYALDSEKELEGMKDPDVLELAISEGRVLVTANVSDFVALITELNVRGRSHTGCVCVPRSISNEEFGVSRTETSSPGVPACGSASVPVFPDHVYAIGEAVGQGGRGCQGEFEATASRVQGALQSRRRWARVNARRRLVPRGRLLWGVGRQAR